MEEEKQELTEKIHITIRIRPNFEKEGQTCITVIDQNNLNVSNQ